MHTPDSIETTLARLMPPALSESGRKSIETMLDELAATRQNALPARKRHTMALRFAIPTGIAASILLVATLTRPTPPAALTTTNAPAMDQPGLVLIGETDQMEDIADEGWLGTPDGSAVQAVRCRFLEASRFLDEESGLEVVVSEPREEVVLTPVSTF